MSDSSAAVTVAAAPMFTVAQWQELEHQALIFKYLKAGLPVPPDLLLPIRRALQLLSPSAFFSNSPASLAYCSYYGKNIDPEPGRCRRTDGKKWRCSKDAHPDSKYCERHMNRSRNRSRKPVESQTASQPMSSMKSETTTGNSSSNTLFPTLSFSSVSNSESLCSGSNSLRWQTDSVPYGVSNKEFRLIPGLKPGADEQGYLPEAMGSTRRFGVNSSSNSTWNVTSRIHANSLPEARNVAISQNNYPQLLSLQDFEPRTIDASISKQQQHYVLGRDFGSLGSMKEENQTLQPLFDEWPRCKEMGSYLDGSNENSSSTQLSMAIPRASSSFLSGVHSPNDS